MSGSLVKIQETTVSTGTASVTLSGIDSTFDVYMVKINGLSPDTAENLECRVTESGTANSTANYDFKGKGLKASGGFDNNSTTNATQWDISGSQIHASTGNFNAIIYIFNANNSSEFTSITFETSQFAGASEVYGNQGGGIFTSASSVDGLLFQIDASNNIDAGTFSLYGLKK